MKQSEYFDTGIPLLSVNTRQIKKRIEWKAAQRVLPVSVTSTIFGVLF